MFSKEKRTFYLDFDSRALKSNSFRDNVSQGLFHERNCLFSKHGNAREKHDIPHFLYSDL